MIFYPVWNTYFARYFGGLWFFFTMLLFMLIRPLTAGKGFMFFELFHGMFLRDIRLSSVFLTICLLGQIVGYDVSRTKIKLLKIFEDKAVFHLFNGKVYEFRYSDLSSLNLTNDVFRIFEFTFRDGKKQRISNAIKSRDIALKMIQEKIAKIRITKPTPRIG